MEAILIPPIDNINLIIDHFGYFPTFHDSEILTLQLDRNFEEGSAIITLKIYAFEMSSKAINKKFKFSKHCIITFEFNGIYQNDFDGFNHQNAIYGMKFSYNNNRFDCEIEPAFGLGGFISAYKIKVVNLQVIDKDPKRK